MATARKQLISLADTPYFIVFLIVLITVFAVPFYAVKIKTLND